MANLTELTCDELIKLLPEACLEQLARRYREREYEVVLSYSRVEGRDEHMSMIRKWLEDHRENLPVSIAASPELISFAEQNGCKDLLTIDWCRKGDVIGTNNSHNRFKIVKRTIELRYCTVIE